MVQYIIARKITSNIDVFNDLKIMLQDEGRNMVLATGSIQGSEIDSNLSVSTINVKNKFRLTLEPTMMLLLFGVNINS